MSGTSLTRAENMCARLDTTESHETSFPGGAAKLVGAMIVIAVLWLFVLPWWSRQPAMARHLEWLDERGIDPSAMFYTELDAMDEIIRRQRTTERPGSASPSFQSRPAGRQHR